MKTSSVKHNKSVGKLLRIMEAMAAADGSMKLKEIGEAVGSPPSTVLRFLGTLIDHGYVRKDEQTFGYLLTMRICEVANLVARHLRVQDVSRPFLEALSSRCGESTCLAIEQDLRAVYVAVVDGPDHTLRALQRIGRSAPLHCTGVGKCLLLGHDRRWIDEIVRRKGMARLTPASITSRSALLQELERVKRNGYATDREECESGVRCVAAPLRGVDGAVLGAISVTGPKNRMSMQRMSEISAIVVDAAASISARLGAPMLPLD